MKKENKNQGTLLNRFNFLIHTFCAKSDTKPEINGVFVSSKETCATNSFKIIKVDTPKNLNSNDYPEIPNRPKPISNFKSFILPKEKAKDVLNIFNSQKKSETLPILDNAVVVRNDKDNVEIGKTDLESFNSISSRKIIGEYPKYNDLFVERGKFVEISVNPKFLKEIADFYVSFVDTPVREVKIKVPLKENSPIRFEGKRENKQEAKAVLMPIQNR